SNPREGSSAASHAVFVLHARGHVAENERPELAPRRVMEAPVLRPDGVAPSPVGGADHARVPATAPVVQAAMEVLAPNRYKVQFTASAELHEKLERLRALMRSKVPDGDL